jgi:glycerophosphoryl diester phosphodiesterase
MTAVVIAHRTCPRHEAENSLAGIARAGALGADAVEVDVRLTRDGVPVLVHDRTLLRIAGWPLPTRWLSFDRVRNLVRRDDGLQIPTFEEALNALPTGVMMTIDVKEDRAASAVIDLVRGQYEDRVWLWTRTPSISSRFREALPDVARALLRDVNSPEAARQLIEDAVHSGANMISPPWDQITRDFVADAQGRGLKVVAMAENAESQASKLAAGLDGIVTNWPEEALAVRSGTE